MKPLLFYDIEVFKEDSLVVFKDENKKVVQIFHNDFEGVLELVKSHKLVGYNNYFYDDKILTGMINGYTPYQIKQLNDKLISQQKVNNVHHAIDSLDCFQQIDVSRPGLKKIEGNMGRMILESSIDFTIDRKLTDEELQEVIEYCCYDVDTTIDVYKIREYNYFNVKERLVRMLPEKFHGKAMKWNTTTISANILLEKPLPKWSDIRLGEYDSNGDYEMLKLVPQEVVDMWMDKSRKKKENSNSGVRLFN